MSIRILLELNLGLWMLSRVYFEYYLNIMSLYVLALLLSIIVIFLCLISIMSIARLVA